MVCDDYKLKLQALIDNELPESEIEDVIAHVESCYSCRMDYIEFLKLQRQMKGVGYPGPGKEWFEEQRNGRKIFRFFGISALVLSSLALIGYMFYELFSENEAGLIVKLAMAGIGLGVIIVLAVTLRDRWVEWKKDKYKGVIR